MQRIYYPETLGITLSFSKDYPIYHQFTRVLRISKGERIIFFNGDRKDIVYEVIDITRSSMELLQKNIIEKPLDRASRVTLYQALPNKIEKLEYILQK